MRFKIKVGFRPRLTAQTSIIPSNIGLDCSKRLFISDRAQLVFDFHQIVDGLKEVELGGSRLVDPWQTQKL